MTEELKKQKTGVPVWIRIWATITVVFLFGFGLFAFIDTRNSDIDAKDVVLGVALVAIVFSLIVFLFCVLINWIYTGLEGKQLSEFSRYSLLLVLFAVLMIVLYYVASPYQNCMRNSSGNANGYCLRMTSW
jgi:uncharacterized membrane protein